ncbi:MAG: heat-inducible transcriptional repressor HrcA [Youngiibacter sp.]|nr:heat-inducible transcriptional repressor HrcA [Youngiibacter sp.]
MPNEIDRRKLDILKAIVVDYVTTGDPVGSRTLAKKYELGVSSATIRNEMADLEDMGLLEQPHSSAGRIPSSKGYRLYVDKLMTLDDLSVDEIKFIENRIITMAAYEIERVMKQASMMLSELTNLAVVLKKPNINKCHIKTVQLVQIDQNAILAVIMLDTGSVKNKHIRLRSIPNPEELMAISNLLTLKLRDMTMEAINLEVLNTIKNGLQGHDELFSEVVGAVYESLKSDMGDDYIIEGTSNMLKYHEFADVGKVREFLSLLDNPDAIFKDSDDGSESDGLVIKIGEELDIPEAKDVSVISAHYRINGKNVGTLNLIGPTRLDYSKVVSIINNVTSELNKKLSEEDLISDG